MRSARMILATAAASTVLVLGAPGAYAAAGGDWDQSDSSSYSKEDKEQGKEHDKGSDHDRPHGGMHTGGGALTAVNADDWGTAKDPKYDPETYKDKDQQGGKDSGGWSGKQEEDGGGWSGSHEKPSGGMHTGGGALASPGMTAGGLAVLAVAGAGLYAARRKKTAGSLA
ncbi:hypothetical protein [Streptomyces griseorubiginosus]|uniref:hypothetical protein n=1 Tax=Streptomyces griseorubiginosus TaxID=67304 RepID=UPI0036E7F30B